MPISAGIHTGVRIAPTVVYPKVSLSDGTPVLAVPAARLVAETAIDSASQNLPKAFTCIRKAFISPLPFVFVFLDCSRCSLTPRCRSAISITYRPAREQRKATGHLYA